MKVKLILSCLFISLAGILACQASDNTGPVAWYSFDDSSNLGKDFSANNHDGTNYGVEYQADGVVGGCSYYPGNGQYINVPDNDILDLTNLTVAFWIKTPTDSAPSGQNRILGTWDNRDYGWFGHLYPDSGIYSAMAYGSGNSEHVIPVKYVGRTEWVHVAMAMTPYSCKIYTNGVLGISTNFTIEALLASDVPLRIGGFDSWGWAWLKGWLDEVKIWDRILTVEEIAEEADLDLIMYDLSIKGKTISCTGKKEKFNAKGFLGWNNITGKMTYEAMEESGASIIGNGTLCSDKIAIALATMQINSADGNVILFGKFSKNNIKFKAKFNGGIDSLSGVSSNGITYITGKVIAIKK